jgi:predicted lipid-binding transport protein (Tim44 family)
VQSRSLARAARLLLVAAVTASCATEGAPVAETTTPASATSAASAAATTNAPSPTPKSDDDQIHDTVMAFQDAYNTQNWDVYLNLMCRAMREQFTAPVMERLKTTRTDSGLTQVISVKTKVDGDNATATLDAQNELLGRQTVELPLVREGGWKICKVA